MLVNASLAAFAQLSIGYGSFDYLPNGIQVDYVAGLPDGWASDNGDFELSAEWADVLRSLEEYCALSVLYDIAQLPDAGLRSVSMSGGGGGESLNYTRFEDRKGELEAAFEQFKSNLVDQETPIMVGFIGG
jgi:hypothetical protein